MFRPTIIVALLFAIVAGPSAPARATLVRPFALSELTDHAHSIVRGEVIAEEVIWDADRRELYTLASLEVHEVLAGREQVGDVIIIRQIGGVLDGIGRQVVGTAPLALGDELVVFARSDGAFHYLVGMAQGAFAVTRVAGRPAEVHRVAHVEVAPVVGPARPLAPDSARWETMRSDILRRLVEVGR